MSSFSDDIAFRDFSGLLTKCTTLKAGEFYLCESENYEIRMKVMNERKDQTIQKNSREESRAPACAQFFKLYVKQINSFEKRRALTSLRSEVNNTSSSWYLVFRRGLFRLRVSLASRRRGRSY